MSTASLPPGVWPVMLTPFLEDLAIDWDGLDALVEWYLERGVAGLFAVCGSGEMFQLTPDERLALAARVVERGGDRVPVVASGTFGGPIEEQAAFVRRMAETGVSAVVVLTGEIAAREEDDGIWRAHLERLLDLTVAAPLGFYECPSPYNRQLTPELARWAAGTGRFLFHKDTASRLAPICAKIEAVRGTPLRFYNANTPTLLDSLRAGGDGYSGITANVCPQLYAWLCRHFQEQADQAERLQRFLSLADTVTGRKNPAGSKMFLRLSGLDIQPVCRGREDSFSEHDLRVLEHFRGTIEDMEGELGR